MLAIGFDTSTPNVGVALVDADGVIDVSNDLAANRPGEQLAPAVAALLARNHRHPSDLDVVGVGLGPGPFTGLRVGIVFAAAMGHALSLPVYGTCSLDAIAFSHPGIDELLVLTDARRREVYWARYDASGVRIEGPQVDQPAALVRRLTAGDRLAGAGAVIYRDIFDRDVEDGLGYPDASFLAQHALDELTAGRPPGPLTPLYLRRPDAAASYSAKSVLT